MNDNLRKMVEKDPDGLLTYEYIANHIDSVSTDIDFLIENMLRADRTGQFLVSTARYLHAIDSKGFEASIEKLVEYAIERDREHRYIGEILPDFYGSDFASRAAELSASDNNFRRIYKRLYPSGF